MCFLEKNNWDPTFPESPWYVVAIPIYPALSPFPSLHFLFPHSVFSWCTLTFISVISLHQVFSTNTSQQTLMLTHSWIPLYSPLHTLSSITHPETLPSHMFPLHTSVIHSIRATFRVWPPASLTACTLTLLLMLHLAAPVLLYFFFWALLSIPFLINPQHVMQYLLNK